MDTKLCIFIITIKAATRWVYLETLKRLFMDPCFDIDIFQVIFDKIKKNLFLFFAKVQIFLKNMRYYTPVES